MGNFDKICRGSLIGEVHNKGLYVKHEPSQAKRGTHVSIRSNKLETTPPTPVGLQHPREQEPTQTFRTSTNWFKHDAPAVPQQMQKSKMASNPIAHDTTYYCTSTKEIRPITSRQADHDGSQHTQKWGSKDEFSPRYWRQASCLAPAPAPQEIQFQQRKNLKNREAAKELRRSSKDNKESFSQEILYENAEEGGFESRNATKAYSIDTKTRDDTVDERINNPTFKNSVDWMAFSSPREKYQWAKHKTTQKEQSRHDFLKKKQQSKIAEMQQEDEKPIYTNSVNLIPSKGKKSFPERRSECQLLIQQDPNKPEERRSMRRHEFSEHSAVPQTARPASSATQEVEIRKRSKDDSECYNVSYRSNQVSQAPESQPLMQSRKMSVPVTYQAPQLLQQPVMSQPVGLEPRNIQGPAFNFGPPKRHSGVAALATGAVQINVRPDEGAVRPGHRTSKEVQDVLSWNQVESGVTVDGPQKVLVGNLLIKSDQRKRQPETIRESERTTERSKVNFPAGASPDKLRDHRCSDVLRAHLSMPNLDFNKSPQSEKSKMTFPIYGGTSSDIPSGLSKNYSYLSSFQVSQTKNRAYGLFSPLHQMHTSVLSSR